MHLEIKPTSVPVREKYPYKLQCLGSGFVGSARFWLPGSGYAKICGSTDPDPDPRGKISIKNCKKKPFLLLKPKSELLKKERL